MNPQGKGKMPRMCENCAHFYIHYETDEFGEILGKDPCWDCEHEEEAEDYDFAQICPDYEERAPRNPSVACDLRREGDSQMNPQGKGKIEKSWASCAHAGKECDMSERTCTRLFSEGIACATYKQREYPR